MRKERFLDVNGMNAEYNMRLEKRLKKYNKVQYRDSSRPSISETEIQHMRSASWRNRTRYSQIIVSIVALVLVIAAFVLSWYLTYGIRG